MYNNELGKYNVPMSLLNIQLHCQEKKLPLERATRNKIFKINTFSIKNSDGN